MALIERILAGGRDVLGDEYHMAWFPGDDLLAVCRPRGLPIGNLTSQFWSNCYLHRFDLFVKRELGCKAYLRYVDDFALFGDNKGVLWEWKAAFKERLAGLRLTIHENSAQVLPTVNGIPWLGFVIYPGYRKVKARKVRHATRRLGNAITPTALDKFPSPSSTPVYRAGSTMCVLRIHGDYGGMYWHLSLSNLVM